MSSDPASTPPAPSPVVAPFGSWESPITPTTLVAGATGCNEAVADGTDIWWAESRPDEGGRTALVRWRDSVMVDISPVRIDVRTRVHEYGGGAWWVENGRCVFSNDATGRLLMIDASGDAPGEALALTPEPKRARGWRFADMRLSPDGQTVYAVREDHNQDGSEPRNQIVAIAADGSLEVSVLVDGPDFVSSPRPSPDGSRLAWLQWNHPSMPWDSTELMVASLDANSPTGLGPAERVVGGDGVSVFGPTWSPDGSLAAISDESGWGNVVAAHPGPDSALSDPVAITVGTVEIGTPHWVFGMSRMAYTPTGDLWFSGGTADGDRLGFVPAEWRGRPTATESALIGASIGSTITSLQSLGDGSLIAIVGRHDREREIVRVTPPSDGAETTAEVVRPARELGFDQALFPEPEPLAFPTVPVADGDDNPMAYARYYRPANPGYVGPDTKRPPLLVLAHGGPTTATRNELQLALRYWTSRGWAVVDVDYRGSTGYGRPFMRALDGHWGIADVHDCVAAARFLADRGDVDPDRLAIRGGSAGGFTVLAALTNHDVFAAGASRYGVAELSALATDTHKFESRYLDTLIGPWPEAQDVYTERSPITHVENLSCPTILLQGLEDTIVPPNQAEMMVDVLASKSIPHAYLTFADEGHGFRKAENIVAALHAEESFFAQTFGFTPPGDVPVIEMR